MLLSAVNVPLYVTSVLKVTLWVIIDAVEPVMVPPVTVPCDGTSQSMVPPTTVPLVNILTFIVPVHQVFEPGLFS